jgi:hypothetical protein
VATVKTAARVRQTRLDVEILSSKTFHFVPVYATPTGLKWGPKGRVLPIGEALSVLSKGEARKVRKALRKAGRKDFAGASRS